MFFKASFLQSAELQLIRKDQDFNLFSICRSKKIYFIVLFFAFFQFFNYDGKGKAYLSNKKTLCNKKFPMLPAGTDS